MVLTPDGKREILDLAWRADDIDYLAAVDLADPRPLILRGLVVEKEPITVIGSKAALTMLVLLSKGED